MKKLIQITLMLTTWAFVTASLAVVFNYVGLPLSILWEIALALVWLTYSGSTIVFLWIYGDNEMGGQ